MPKESIVHSPVLGDLKVLPGPDWWILGSCEYLGHPVEITFLCRGEKTFARLLPFAEEIWTHRTRHFKAFRENAIQQLDNLNAQLDCGQESPPQLTETEFDKLLRIPSGVSLILFDESKTYLACTIGKGDPSFEHQYVEVSIGEDGKVVGADVRCLL